MWQRRCCSLQNLWYWTLDHTEELGGMNSAMMCSWISRQRQKKGHIWIRFLSNTPSWMWPKTSVGNWHSPACQCEWEKQPVSERKSLITHPFGKYDFPFWENSLGLPSRLITHLFILYFGKNISEWELTSAFLLFVSSFKSCPDSWDKWIW